MADAVELSRFVTRAAADPDTGGHGSESRHVFGQNSDAVRESGGFERRLSFDQDPKWGFLTMWFGGGVDPSTAQKWRQRATRREQFWADLRA